MTVCLIDLVLFFAFLLTETKRNKKELGQIYSHFDLNDTCLFFDKISTYETLVVKNGYCTLAKQRLAKNVKYSVWSNLEWKRTY